MAPLAGAALTVIVAEVDVDELEVTVGDDSAVAAEELTPVPDEVQAAASAGAASAMTAMAATGAAERMRRFITSALSGWEVAQPAAAVTAMPVEKLKTAFWQPSSDASPMVTADDNVTVASPPAAIAVVSPVALAAPTRVTTDAEAVQVVAFLGLPLTELGA